MKREDTYHSAINEFLNAKAGEYEKRNHFFRIDAIGAGKRMTQIYSIEQGSRLSKGKKLKDRRKTPVDRFLDLK